MNGKDVTEWYSFPKLFRKQHSNTKFKLENVHSKDWLNRTTEKQRLFNPNARFTYQRTMLVWISANWFRLFAMYPCSFAFWFEFREWNATEPVIRLPELDLKKDENCQQTCSFPLATSQITFSLSPETTHQLILMLKMDLFGNGFIYKFR